MILTQDQMQTVVDDLQETCGSIDQVLMASFHVERIEITNELELCDYIDQRIFKCAQCGWWCEAGDWVEYELNPNPGNGDICTSCGEENGWVE